MFDAIQYKYYLILWRKAFLFWTSLTALHPQIFFFSVYNMGVGGHEALLIIQVIALSLSLVPPIQRWLIPSKDSALSSSISSIAVGHTRYGVLAVLYALCLSGFIAWPLQNPLFRLIATGISCAGFSVLTAITFGRAWELDEVENCSTGEFQGRYRVILNSSYFSLDHRTFVFELGKVWKPQVRIDYRP